MKNISKKLLGPVQVIILAVIISAGASYVYATGSFAEPGNGCTPPSCNADAPVNIGGTMQFKNGGLTVGNSPVQVGLVVASGNVGILTSSPTQALDVVGNVQATAFYYRSDRNLKQNITPLTDSLNKIGQLQGVSFSWKPGTNGPSGTQIGLIAQDVQKVYPEAVSTDGKSVEYANLVAPLIEAVKAQQQEIVQLQAQVNQLKGNK